MPAVPCCLTAALTTALVCFGLFAPVAAAATDWLTVLHTNDIHGGYTLREATWLDERPLVGGFLALSGTVEAIRAERTEQNVILLDAGDLMTGNPLTVIDYHGVTGGGAMAFLNALRYDAMTLGNHEFDNGRRELEGLIGMAGFPVLAANLWIEATHEPFVPAHTLIERGGLRVAVIGLILEELAAVTAAEPLRGLVVESIIEAARREVAKLDPSSDLIIVLLHAGLDAAERVAGAVDGIDVIVAGHDHRRTREPRLANGTLIVESGGSLANMGRLDLRVEEDRVIEHRYVLELLEESATAQASIAVRAVHDECDAAIQAEYGAEIATLEQPLERRGDTESNVGNWVTDAYREAAGTDIALTNSSGIRANIEAGPITRLDIHRLLPFQNLLSTFHCTGRELERFVEQNVAYALNGRHSIMQISGLRYAYDDSGTVHQVVVAGEPLEYDRVYTGATSDYVLFSQVERYLGFVPAERERTVLNLTDLVTAAATRQGRIDAKVDGRVTRLAPVSEPGEPVSSREP